MDCIRKPIRKPPSKHRLRSLAEAFCSETRVTHYKIFHLDGISFIWWTASVLVKTIKDNHLLIGKCLVCMNTSDLASWCQPLYTMLVCPKCRCDHPLQISPFTSSLVTYMYTSIKKSILVQAIAWRPAITWTNDYLPFRKQNCFRQWLGTSSVPSNYMN